MLWLAAQNKSLTVASSLSCSNRGRLGSCNNCSDFACTHHLLSVGLLQRQASSQSDSQKSIMWTGESSLLVITVKTLQQLQPWQQQHMLTGCSESHTTVDSFTAPCIVFINTLSSASSCSNLHVIVNKIALQNKATYKLAVQFRLT